MSQFNIKIKSTSSLNKSNNSSSLFGVDMMKNTKQTLKDKKLFLYVLYKNRFASLQNFKSLLEQLKSFNQELQTQNQIKNFVRIYYLYKGLFDRLNQISIFCKNTEQANQKSNQISKWFFQEKYKFLQVKKQTKSQINIQEDSFEAQNLRKTIFNIKAKRQSQVHEVMAKSSYSSFFPSKQRISQYKSYISEQIKSNLSSNISQQKGDILPRFQSTSKLTNLTKASTNLDHRKTFSNFGKASNSLNYQNNTKKPEWSISKSTTVKQRSTFYLVSDVINKNKLDEQIDCPDQLHYPAQKKQDFQLHEQNYIQNQKIKFLNRKDKSKYKSQTLLKVKGGQHQSKKDFISINKQIIKLRQQKSRFRLEANRKMQSYRYLSQLNSRVIRKKQPIKQDQQNILNYVALKSQSNPQIVENKLIDTKKSLQLNRQTIVSARYLNHLNNKSQRSQANQDVYADSDKLKLHVINYKNKFQEEEDTISLNQYKKKFAQKHKRSLPIVKILQKNSFQNYNDQVRQNVFSIKQKLASKLVTFEYNKLNRGLRVNIDKIIQQNQQFQAIKKDLCSNPFFVVKKGKSKKKSKTKN